MTDRTTGPILFYDGQCGLCDRTVRWVIARDHRGRVRFAPLDGETYAAVDHPDKPTDRSTIVVLTDTTLLTRSDAAIHVLRMLGGPWQPLGAIARVCPRPIRDAAYRFVARHRLRVFGGAEACRLPDARERSQLLP